MLSLNQCKYKMDIIFVNSENSKTSYPHELLLNLTEKIDLSRRERSVALSNASIYNTWEKMES